MELEKETDRLLKRNIRGGRERERERERDGLKNRNNFESMK